MLRVQLHMHTTVSRGTRIEYDSIITPMTAINTLVRSGVDAVAVTDHNTTRAYNQMNRIGERKGVYVIRGIEIDTVGGHIIGLGVEDGIDHNIKRRGKGLTALEAADLIRDFNGEVYIPHPFDIQKKGLGTKIPEVDGIVEVFKPMNIFRFENELAHIVASELERPKAVGSDAHIIYLTRKRNNSFNPFEFAFFYLVYPQLWLLTVISSMFKTSIKPK